MKRGLFKTIFYLKEMATILSIQQTLDYMESLDSHEYSDEGIIICLPPPPIQSWSSTCCKKHCR